MNIKTINSIIRDIYGVVFDKDGTLVGGVSLWKKIFDYQMDSAEDLGLNIREIATEIFGAREAFPYSPLVTFHASEAPILLASAIWLTYKLPWSKCKDFGKKIIDMGGEKISREELYKPLPYAIPAIDFFYEKLPVCIATSDSKENTIDMINYLHLEDKIKYFVSSDEVENGKPDADILIKISENINIKTENLVLIGDNEIDVETAKNAGAKSIIVGDEDLGADGWIKNLLELINFNNDEQ